MADTIFNIATIITLAAMLISFVRLLLGPDTVSRIVALDGMTIMSVSFIAWLSLWSGRGIYLDVALVYSLISFTGVVALARYLERGL